MIGMPPPTEASNPISTSFSTALLKTSGPCLARSALFAVTMCLCFSAARMMSSLATIVPPISSMTISISGWSKTSIGSSVKISSGIPRTPFLFVSLSATFATFRSMPVLFRMRFLFLRRRSHTPLPTVPMPSIPNSTFLMRLFYSFFIHTAVVLYSRRPLFGRARL